MLQKSYYQKFNSDIIPIFIPHMGCPNDCVFCNQRKITGLQTSVEPQNIKEIIESYLKFKLNTPIVAFYGGSFTALPIELQEEFYNVVNDYIVNGKLSGIKLSTRPDAIDDDVIYLLKKYKVGLVELGVQSLNQTVLDNSKRNHSVEDVYKACEKLKSNSISYGLQQMLGLPGDNHLTNLETTRKIIQLLPECVRIYPTIILKGTELERMYIAGQYKPLTMKEAVALAARIYSEYYINDINVIRVGLQSSNELDKNDSVIGGPYHPAFGSMVDDYIYSLIFTKHLDQLSEYIKIKRLTIYSNNFVKSSLAGLNGQVKKMLKNRYKLKSIKFLSDDFEFDCIKILINDDIIYHLNMRNELVDYWRD